MRPLPSYAVLFLAALPARAGDAPAPRPPNVIVLLADDLGYGDVGCYGAKPEHVKTPSIDRLAKEGLRFTDAHAPSSVCTPSRYALLAGEYPFRNRKAWTVLPGDAPLAFTPGSFTLPEMFRSKGYATGFVGKWHLGLGDGGAIDWNGDIKPGPMETGFGAAFYMPATGDRVPTVFVRGHRVEDLDPADPIAVSYTRKIGDDPTGREDPEQATVLNAKDNQHDGTITQGVSRIGWMTGGKAARWTDEKLMDRLTDEAIAFITRNKDKPFFLYYAAHGVHEPRVPAKRFVGKSGAGVYGDQIEELDDSVGRVMKALADLELADDTLVIFSSDNGATTRDLDRNYDYGQRVHLNGHVMNGPLAGGKYTALEGGTRVPMIVRWPGHVAGNGTSPALISLMDLQASLAPLIGARIPAGAAKDSADLQGALLGDTKIGRHELVEHRYEAKCALRVDNWKWIDGQLYDLATDLGETRDLAKEQPERAQAMKARLKELTEAKKTR